MSSESLVADYGLPPRFEVKLDRFSGPLDKLLELIEARELDITQMSLAAVTVDFIEYVRTLGEHASPQVLADFLVVASRLVLIKSKTLLPSLELSEEEETEIHDLELRLSVYRQFAARSGPASVNLRRRWELGQASFARSLLPAIKNLNPASGLIFYPGSNLGIDTLRAALGRLAEELQAIAEPPGKVARFVVSLQEKIGELLERCRQVTNESFRQLSANRPREEIVVMFLALLHLLRRRAIHVEQQGTFGDILLKQKSSSLDATVDHDYETEETP